MLAKLGSGHNTVKSARAVPAEDPEVGGYFVEVTDSLGNTGTLIGADACNVSQDKAQTVAQKAIGQQVEMWE